MSNPTHRHIPTGALVFPGGCDADELEPLAAGEWDAIELVRLEADLHGKVDREAGAFRCRFITEIAGQQLTYDRKEREARDYLEAAAAALDDGTGQTPPPDPADYIFLSAEATATGQALDTLAQEIVANADMWAQLGAAIEGQRIGAKRAVTLAKQGEGTFEELAGAMRAAAVVDWDALGGG